MAELRYLYGLYPEDVTKHLLAAICLVVAWPALAGNQAEDSSLAWRQWGGPDRNFHSKATGLARSWPGDGPRQLWSRLLGEGYSTVIAEDGALYTMYREEARVSETSHDQEIVVALDADSGETLWEHRYDAPPPKDMPPVFDFWLSQAGPGPYSTPLISGDRLFAVGVTGKFHTLNKRTGEVLWTHDLQEAFGMSLSSGYASSPIAYRDTVILPVGGTGHGVVAFRQSDGTVVWKKQDFALAPASPILINLDGENQLVLFTGSRIAGLDPRNGDLFWSHPHETDYGLNISTPVWGDGNLLFCSSAYNGGSRVLRLSRVDGKTSAQELWFNNRMRLHFGNAIRIGNSVYGTSGDFGPAFFAALDINTGVEAWRERGFGRSQMIYADGMFVIIDEDGDLVLATPSAEGLDVHSRAEALTDNAWTAPTLVGTRLYLRDRKSIRAFELGK